MSEAEFARQRQVSRQTVMTWKRRGNIVMIGGQVDVGASDRMLADRPEVYRGGTATQRPGETR
jgi:hypothetical protein